MNMGDCHEFLKVVLPKPFFFGFFYELGFLDHLTNFFVLLSGDGLRLLPLIHDGSLDGPARLKPMERGKHF